MTEAELEAIRAGWRWARADHAVARLLEYIDELEAEKADKWEPERE